MYLNRAGQIPIGDRLIANRLPPQVRRGLLTTGLTPPPGMDETYRKSFAKMIEFAGLLYRSGIAIESGTDSMAGFALHRELELDVQAGIPAQVVLQDATLGAARIMSLDQELGSITPGKLADLILVDGDPTANISNIRKTVVVVKDGVLYNPAELYSELGVSP
jgi:imidazolonepropionase-like amidohydrolase